MCTAHRAGSPRPPLNSQCLVQGLAPSRCSVNTEWINGPVQENAKHLGWLKGRVVLAARVEGGGSHREDHGRGEDVAVSGKSLWPRGRLGQEKAASLPGEP